MIYQKVKSSHLVQLLDQYDNPIADHFSVDNLWPFFQGGLSYDENYDQWLDSTHLNSKACYKNVDPAQFYDWTKHGELMRGRSTHNTVYMDGQLYHIAGYAKG